MRRLVKKQQTLRHLIAQRTRELEAEKIELVAAREAYQRAARMTASLPEQRYLALRAARLA